MATNVYLNTCKNHQPSHSSKTNQLALFGHALLPSVVFSVGEVMAAVGHRGARFESAELQVTRCSGAARVYLLLLLHGIPLLAWMPARRFAGFTWALYARRSLSPGFTLFQWCYPTCEHWMRTSTDADAPDTGAVLMLFVMLLLLGREVHNSCTKHIF